MLGFEGTDSVLLATGILGATVMPHVIYLHSALTQRRIAFRNDDECRQMLRYNRWDVFAAMGIAGIVNMAMPVVAAALFFGAAEPVETIEQAHAAFGAALGSTAAIAFALALLASGFVTSTVGAWPS